MMNNKGFTLVEVLAVVAIIAVLGLVATPGVLSMINTSKGRSYEIMIDNIKVAAGELYQELDYMNTNIYRYDSNGRLSEVVAIDSDFINVNLQTLVSNGFLVGSSNDNYDVNQNNKIILEPYNNMDIGLCGIKITKFKNGSKFCYKIESTNTDEFCPTSEDFGGDRQCIS